MGRFEKFFSKEQLKDYLTPIVFFIIIIIMWEFVVEWLKIPTFLIPKPSDIVVSFYRLRNLLIYHTWITLLEVLIGFFIGVSGGILIGIAISYSKILKRILYPLAIFLKVIPIVAIAPLLVIWFGFGLASKIICVALICFFPVIVNTALGITSVPSSLIELLYSLSASELQIFLKIRFRWALPYIFSALKIASTVSVVGAVVGEFISATEGLGYLALIGISYIDTPQVFVTLIILAIMGLVLFGVTCIIERILIPWKSES